MITSCNHSESFVKSRNKFIAQITGGSIHYNLGYFETALLAAAAYNKAALELHGEFAALNNIPEVS